MAKNSLFAILLRSPWWISIVIAAGIVVAARLVFPGVYAFAFFAALPFIVIGGVAGWRQLRAPSAARVADTLEAVRAMSLGDFSNALANALHDDGYTVSRLTGAAADFELAKGDALPGRLQALAARTASIAARSV
jgi:restriction system protein